MDWGEKTEILDAMHICESAFSAGILSHNFPHACLRPRVTLMLIGLNDLLQKAKNAGKHIAITDDVEVTPQRKDLTDLVNESRNAACHFPSKLNLLNQGTRFVFNSVRGKVPTAFKVGDLELGCDYADDVAVYWGATRLYLRRNALVGFEAAKTVFGNVA